MLIFDYIRHKNIRTEETLSYGISKSHSFTCDNKWFEPMTR